MQTLTSPMQAALVMRSSTSLTTVTRPGCLLYELYPPTYFPPIGSGFDPANATALFAEVGITWLGRQYKRYVAQRGDVQRFLTTQFNNCNIGFANNDLFMSGFVIANDVEGMRIVLRWIDYTRSATLADSIVIAVNRLDRPDTIDEEDCAISSKQELGSVNWEIPKRTFNSQDQSGRSPADKLYEGFQFTAEHGNFQYVTVVTKRFLIFFSKKVRQLNTLQWTSETGTSQDQVVPLIFGRCQMELIPVIWADVGFFIAGLWVGAGHKITSFTDVTIQDPNFLTDERTQKFAQAYIDAHSHLGDLGGTGTNSAPERIINATLAPQGWLESNTAYLSRTAYLGLAPFGPESPVASFPNGSEDAVPTITSIMLGECDLPNSIGIFEQSVTSITSSGGTATGTKTAHGYETGQSIYLWGALQPEYNGNHVITVTGVNTFTFAVIGSPASPATGTIQMVRKGFSDNPAYLTRFFLISTDTIGMDPRLIDDLEINLTAAICDEIVKDTTAAELLPLSSDQAQALQDGLFTRYKSSGVVSSEYQKYKISTSGPNPWTTPRKDALIVNVAPIEGGGGCPDGQHPDPLTGTCVDDGQSGIIPPTGVFYRRRWTFNAPLTAKTKTMDFLFNVLLPAFRGYILIGPDGRLKVRTERPSDSTYIRAAASAGANTVQVNDVEPWRTSAQGLLLIGPNLITSETRKVTATAYSSAGNSITTSASVTGSTTLAASGATLTGGTSSVPPSGTFTVGGSAAAGNILNAVIDGVTVSYQLVSADNLNSAAGMLAAAINAEWSLKSYIRAVWSTASPNVVTVFSKLGVLTLEVNLTNNHPALLASPTAVPTATAVSGGSLTAGTYYWAYSWQGATGETFVSPVQSIAVTAGQRISQPTISLPSGAASVNWYLSKAPGDPTLGFLVNNFGASFFVNVLPVTDARPVPIVNGAGEETIRVMASFTKENVLEGKFRWPLASKTNSTNQVLIKFRSAVDGFAPRELYVNDKAHQTKIGGIINKVEIDGSGVDSLNQAWRLSNGTLSKERQGNFFAEWDTDEAGLAFEEGDVVCVSDVSGGFVNMPMRIDELSIHEDLTVTIVGRLYSTIMYSDQTGVHQIALPSTLKYLNQAPPVAANFVVTEVGGLAPDLSWNTGLRGDFDFGPFNIGQRALIYLQRTSSPADADYRLVDTALPDPNDHGSFEIRALPIGTYNVKVVTESAFGFSASIGHPITSIALSPSLATILKIFDTIAPRDVEMGLGATIGVARATGTGVWFGTNIQRDRGYGYEIVATLEREASVGHTDPAHAFLASTAGTLYMVLEGGASPSDATLDEIAAGKGNWFVGSEKIGVQTWTNLGSGIWRGTNLVRGMSGTDYVQASHTVQEDVMLLDENITFVPLEARDIDQTLLFKPVTYGSSLGATTAQTLNFYGWSVVPHPPASFDGPFDSISGDEQLEWTEGSDDEPIVFDLEVTNGSIAFSQRIVPSNLSRSGDPVSFMIIADPDAPGSPEIELIENGGINGTMIGSTATADSLGRSAPLGGLLFEFEIPDDSRVAPRQVVVYPEDELYSSSTYGFAWLCGQERNPSTFVPEGPFYMYPETSEVGSVGWDARRIIRAGDRPYIFLRPDGVAEFGFNYVGASSRPVFISARPIKPAVLYKVTVATSSAFTNAAGCGIRHPRWLRQTPTFRLYAEVQRRIFALTAPTLPAEIHARVRQLSRFSYGHASDWTTGIFTR